MSDERDRRLNDYDVRWKQTAAKLHARFAARMEAVQYHAVLMSEPEGHGFLFSRAARECASLLTRVKDRSRRDPNGYFR